MNLIFDIYFTLPEIYLVTTILFLLVFGVLVSNSNFLGYPLLHETIGWLSIQSLIITFILISYLPYLSFTSWNFLFIYDYFVFGIKSIIINFSILWVFSSIFYMKKEKVNSYEFWIFILFAIFTFLCIFQVQDYLTLYLLIELQSLLFYILVSFRRSCEFSTEAGLKYFVLGAFSSAFLLFGISLLYGLTGLTNFDDFNIFLAGFALENVFFVLGIMCSLVFIISALFFKLSAAPFHMWTPDVYEGAPFNTVAFFSIFSKVVIVILLFKIYFFAFYDLFYFWKSFFLISSFLSLLIGSLGALVQKKWKRFIAFSSINHVGFILIGFLLGENFSVISILIYIYIYMVTSLAIFTFLIGLRFYEYPKNYQLRYITEIINLSKVHPLLAGAITLILFSMAGLPPLAGFFAKVFILISGIQSGTYGLIIFSIIVSSISCFYYIRLIQLVYFLNIQKWPITYPMEKSISIILGITIFLILFFFLDIELIYLPFKRMVLSYLL